MRRTVRLTYMALAAMLVHTVLCTAAAAAPLASARNGTVSTLCAEHDNVCVGLSAPTPYTIASFTIEARHPGYAWTVDHTDPDFTNCQPTGEPVYQFTPSTTQIATAGKTAIVAVTEAQWWRPRGMTAIGSITATDVHYIAMHCELSPGHWPQVLVIYADGNIRAKPFAPEGVFDTVFGSSVIVGPVEQTTRPFAAIDSLQFSASPDRFQIVYENGQTAELVIEELTRDVLRMRIDASGLILEENQRFANFRSMFVSEGNADADHMAWGDDTGAAHDDPILEFAGGLGSEFFLHRQTLSIHNTSAPDIWIGGFEVVPEPATVSLLLIGSAVLLGCRRAHRRSRCRHAVATDGTALLM